MEVLTMAGRQKKTKDSESGTKKTYVQALVDDDMLAAIDALCGELDMSRSYFVAMCVENTLEDWEFLRRLGVTPRRARRIVDVLRKLGMAPPRPDFRDLPELDDDSK